MNKCKCTECEDRFKCDFYMHDCVGSTTVFDSKKLCEILPPIESRIYKIKRSKNSKVIKNVLLKELDSPRIKELMKTRVLRCEYFPDLRIRNNVLHNNMLWRFQSIDPANTVATILEIDDEYITIEMRSNDNKENSKILREILEFDVDLVRAHERVVGSYNNHKEFILKGLVTFDIIPYTITKENKDKISKIYSMMDKRKVVEEIIETIEKELNNSNSLYYNCEDNSYIETSVGFIKQWFNKYKEVLRRKYSIKKENYNE